MIFLSDDSKEAEIIISVDCKSISGDYLTIKNECTRIDFNFYFNSIETEGSFIAKFCNQLGVKTPKDIFPHDFVNANNLNYKYI